MIGEAFSSYFFSPIKSISTSSSRTLSAQVFFMRLVFVSNSDWFNRLCAFALIGQQRKTLVSFFSGAWRWLNFVALSCDWFVAFQVDIPVRIVGGETVLVTFTGVGYDQRIMGDTLPVRDMGSTTVPDKQVVQVPKQVCVSVTVFKALYPLQQ